MWKEQRRYAQKSNYYSRCSRTAKESEFPGRLIPIPSEISAQCGLAWKCVEQSEEETENFLKKKELAWDGIYRVLV